jgi:hypothetical protein
MVESDSEVFAKENIMCRVNDQLNNYSMHKSKFCKALSLAMAESKALRDFIKEEALDKFDNDYDILYYRSKDKIVTSDLTFREILLPFFENDYELDIIESEFPLLTILVTELPMDIFSAEKWDTNETIPFVAYIPNKKSEFIYVNTKGDEFQVEKGHLLADAFIIVKSSDRVSITDVSLPIKSNEKICYEYDFNSPYFNKSKNEVNKKGWISTNKIETKGWYSIMLDYPEYSDHKLPEAYNIYKNHDGWQRDFIYYDISPTHTRGGFNYDYMESIHNFSLNASTDQEAMDMFRYISDSVDDPSSISSFIEDGAFEFIFKCFVNGVNGIGSQIDLYLQCSARDLFIIVWGWGIYPETTYIQSISTRTLEDLYIPIVGWDIHDYTTSFKVTIEEIDPSGSTTITETQTSSVATNFELSAGIEKIGMKYGASAKTDITSRVQRVIHDKNDPLGDVTLNFADDFIIGYERNNWFGYLFDQYETRDYNTGMCTIDFLPVKVQ